MNKKLFENEYVQTSLVFINQEQTIYSYRWKQANKYLSPEMYQTETRRHRDYIQKYKPTFVMADFQESQFIISADLQPFVKTQVLDKMVETGTKKLAIIPPEDNVLKMSIEQTLEEQTAAPYAIRFFESVDEAKIWFVKKDIWHAYAHKL
ncbi:hypothetical protein [Microscilla marina]|uniref:Uncharacterized protein n=1 Tax=Microscilla marina ATCC 23134 TaxID=313606 RepID=A1ZD26_MICM2|nr:hypothetical protein [Microscilla marina]EAY31565.1 hypothetical protein M23134_05071 [Microscilla marina ATCC 23134]